VRRDAFDSLQRWLRTRHLMKLSFFFISSVSSMLNLGALIWVCLGSTKVMLIVCIRHRESFSFEIE
jgi:hypothetical protein